MRAVRMFEYGGPEVLELVDIESPVVAADEVLIQVKASSINPVDWKIREGYLKDFIPYELPVTLGWDVAGVVTQLGDNVTGFKIGDEVFSRPAIHKNGSYADFIAVTADEVAFKPPGLDFSQAASLPLAGITAYQCLVDVAEVKAGDRVLIHAGAGGVGHLAIQIAKAKGAYVIATASATNQELLRELGADEAIDYAKAPLAEQISKVDIVLDSMGGDVLAASWELLNANGIVVSIVEPPSEEKAKEYSVRVAFVFIEPSRRILNELRALVDSNQLKPLIENRFSLEQIKEAHALSQSGRTRGKIVIDV
ncbi:NADP-dependent oxidoreductase [Alginatibacterium sediminis]|uniref:NADP-dependent oxidoreductase n=1 Tax=Alginatibacterium sediminis TaxID=2164068 RepID=A0A420E6B2_9ALTE|nr:NADP-dependent oxidoreductase [Alginatibacterium sediminis]RKF13686.1 NADP-dependent oxidoreductase [Alginatibacterium sediminis]